MKQEIKTIASLVALPLLLAGSLCMGATPTFVKGDKLECGDDVSGEVSTIKIMSTFPISAYVRFEKGEYSRFYRTAEVITTFEDGELRLKMKPAGGGVEILILPPSLKLKEGMGYYADGGDSRYIYCTLVAAGADTEVDAGKTIYLTRAQSDLFVTNPLKLQGIVPQEAIAIAGDSRMVPTFNKLVSAVRSEGYTPAVLEYLDSTIGFAIRQSPSRLMIWLDGAADERYSSQYQVYIEYDMAAKRFIEWTDVEYIDHP